MRCDDVTTSWPWAADGQEFRHESIHADESAPIRTSTIVESPYGDFGGQEVHGSQRTTFMGARHEFDVARVAEPGTATEPERIYVPGVEPRDHKELGQASCWPFGPRGFKSHPGRLIKGSEPIGDDADTFLRFPEGFRLLWPSIHCRTRRSAGLLTYEGVEHW